MTLAARRALARPPIESPEPVLRFAALRLLIAITGLVVLVAAGAPFEGHLTAVVAAVGLPWGIGMLLLAQRRPDMALNPLVAVGDIAALAIGEIAAPDTYGVIRFVAIFFIAASTPASRARGSSVPADASKEGASTASSITFLIAAIKGNWPRCARFISHPVTMRRLISLVPSKMRLMRASR